VIWLFTVVISPEVAAIRVCPGVCFSWDDSMTASAIVVGAILTSAMLNPLPLTGASSEKVGQKKF
jgi:hypothetical protein